jgi:hypothetical protein
MNCTWEVSGTNSVRLTDTSLTSFVVLRFFNQLPGNPILLRRCLATVLEIA